MKSLGEGPFLFLVEAAASLLVGWWASPSNLHFHLFLVFFSVCLSGQISLYFLV